MQPHARACERERRNKMIENVNPIGMAGAVNPIESAAATGPKQLQGIRSVTDTVEISEVAHLAAKVQDIPDVRQDLVAAAKAEIAGGTFETPQRIEIAIDRLMEDMFPSW